MDQLVEVRPGRTRSLSDQIARWRADETAFACALVGISTFRNVRKRHDPPSLACDLVVVVAAGGRSLGGLLCERCRDRRGVRQRRVIRALTNAVVTESL